jgi:signal transduction histidine kinase
VDVWWLYWITNVALVFLALIACWRAVRGARREWWIFAVIVFAVCLPILVEVVDQLHWNYRYVALALPIPWVFFYAYWERRLQWMMRFVGLSLLLVQTLVVATIPKLYTSNPNQFPEELIFAMVLLTVIGISVLSIISHQILRQLRPASGITRWRLQAALIGLWLTIPWVVPVAAFAQTLNPDLVFVARVAKASFVLAMIFAYAPSSSLLGVYRRSEFGNWSTFTRQLGDSGNNMEAWQVRLRNLLPGLFSARNLYIIPIDRDGYPQSPSHEADSAAAWLAKQPAGSSEVRVCRSLYMAVAIENNWWVISDKLFGETFHKDEMRLLEQLSVFLEAGLMRAEASAEIAAAQGREKAAEKLQIALLAALSHQIRTPLTAITGLTGVLRDQEGKLDATQRREIIGHLDKESKRLNTMLEELMSISDAEQELLTPRWQAVDVQALCAKLLEEKRFKEVYYEVEAGVDNILADPEQLRRIILHLLNNALVHNPRGTLVWLKVSSAPNGCYIIVEDAGRGIPSNLHAEVLQPFQRIESSAEDHSPGVGVGLSIVNMLVRAHGGKLMILSRNDGGSIFKIWLPQAPGLPEPPEDE